MINKPLTVFSCNLAAIVSVPGAYLDASSWLVALFLWRVLGRKVVAGNALFFSFLFVFLFSPCLFFSSSLSCALWGAESQLEAQLLSPDLSLDVFAMAGNAPLCFSLSLSLSLVFSFVSLSLCCAPRCCVTAGAMVSFHSVCPWCRSPSWEHPPPVSFFHQCAEPLRE